MRKGKLQQSVLVRSVFKMLGQKREDAAGPAVGRGVSALAGEKETQVFSCAPVLVKDPEDAALAVCRVCNSVAAAGASAKGVLVSLMLRREFDIVRASDGEEAVRICRELKPAAILMDVKMPGMDGLEATRRIRAFDPSVPIVAVTAFAYDRDRQKALDAGASEYLSKPLNGERLRQTLRELLSEE